MALAAEPIYRCRRSIDERCALLNGVVEYLLRAGEIVVHHVDAVVYQCVRARPLMKDRLDMRNSQFPLVERAPELPLVHIVHKPGAAQVEVLSRIGKIIDDKDVGNTMQIQLMDQIAADKSRTARNDIHILFLRWQLGHPRSPLSLTIFPCAYGRSEHFLYCD